jgi:hypothetical protein
MEYVQHLNFVRIVNAAMWFKTFEAFHKAFATYPEKILDKAWKRAKGE